MARPQLFRAQPSRRTAAALLSAVLHLGLVALILLAGGRADGTRDDTAPPTRLVLLDASSADRREGLRGLPRTPQAPAPSPDGRVPPPDAESPAVPPDPVGALRMEPPTIPPPAVEIPRVEAEGSRLVDLEAEEANDAAPAAAAGPARPRIMAEAQSSDVQRRIERLAGELAKSPRATVTWQQDGREYHAELVLQAAHQGLEPQRATVEVRTEEQGRELRTWISLKRLPFSHFAKLIDRWDPMVQLHDDEVVGRMHVNSRFNLLYDSQAAPRLAGKVTTAAGGFNRERRGRQRDADVFLEGIETRAGRIGFFEGGPVFEWQGPGEGARVHELARTAWIRFLGDGGYMWREGESGPWQHAESPARQPVFFVAAPGAAVHVQGTVAGQFLVYSPRRIVLQGDVTYVRDPRSEPESGDYLGLVSDRDIEVAPPAVTGPGDLHIHAAMFAGRRMVVADADHRMPARLSILGSLAAGTLTESEPRFAMRIEYDRRFDRHRPPGFPSTNRFALEEWDRQWTEVSAGSPSGGHSWEER